MHTLTVSVSAGGVDCDCSMRGIRLELPDGIESEEQIAARARAAQRTPELQTQRGHAAFGRPLLRPHKERDRLLAFSGRVKRVRVSSANPRTRSPFSAEPESMPERSMSRLSVVSKQRDTPASLNPAAQSDNAAHTFEDEARSRTKQTSEANVAGKDYADSVSGSSSGSDSPNTRTQYSPRSRRMSTANRRARLWNANGTVSENNMDAWMEALNLSDETIRTLMESAYSGAIQGKHIHHSHAAVRSAFLVCAQSVLQQYRELARDNLQQDQAQKLQQLVGGHVKAHLIHSQSELARRVDTQELLKLFQDFVNEDLDNGQLSRLITVELRQYQRGTLPGRLTLLDQRIDNKLQEFDDLKWELQEAKIRASEQMMEHTRAALAEQRMQKIAQMMEEKELETMAALDRQKLMLEKQAELERTAAALTAQRMADEERERQERQAREEHEQMQIMRKMSLIRHDMELKEFQREEARTRRHEELHAKQQEEKLAEAERRRRSLEASLMTRSRAARRQQRKGWLTKTAPESGAMGPAPASSIQSDNEHKRLRRRNGSDSGLMGEHIAESNSVPSMAFASQLNSRVDPSAAVERYSDNPRLWSTWRLRSEAEALEAEDDSFTLFPSFADLPHFGVPSLRTCPSRIADEPVDTRVNIHPKPSDAYARLEQVLAPTTIRLRDDVDLLSANSFDLSFHTNPQKARELERAMAVANAENRQQIQQLDADMDTAITEAAAAALMTAQKQQSDSDDGSEDSSSSGSSADGASDSESVSDDGSESDSTASVNRRRASRHNSDLSDGSSRPTRKKRSEERPRVEVTRVTDRSSRRGSRQKDRSHSRQRSRSHSESTSRSRSTNHSRRNSRHLDAYGDEPMNQEDESVSSGSPENSSGELSIKPKSKKKRKKKRKESAVDDLLMSMTISATVAQHVDPASLVLGMDREAADKETQQEAQRLYDELKVERQRQQEEARRRALLKLLAREAPATREQVLALHFTADEWSLHEQSQQVRAAVASLKLSAPLDHRLKRVWLLLGFNASDKLEMLEKYQRPPYAQRLKSSLPLMEKACALILKRELVLASLRLFEAHHCDPVRLFRTDGGLSMIEETSQRRLHLRRLELRSAPLERVLQRLIRRGEDLCYRGRSYFEKMQSDYTDMLYALQQDRIVGRAERIWAGNEAFLAHLRTILKANTRRHPVAAPMLSSETTKGAHGPREVAASLAAESDAELNARSVVQLLDDTTRPTQFSHFHLGDGHFIQSKLPRGDDLIPAETRAPVVLARTDPNLERLQSVLDEHSDDASVENNAAVTAKSNHDQASAPSLDLKWSVANRQQQHAKTLSRHDMVRRRLLASLRTGTHDLSQLKIMQTGSEAVTSSFPSGSGRLIETDLQRDAKKEMSTWFVTDATYSVTPRLVLPDIHAKSSARREPPANAPRKPSVPSGPSLPIVSAGYLRSLLENRFGAKQVQLWLERSQTQST